MSWAWNLNVDSKNKFIIYFWLFCLLAKSRVRILRTDPEIQERSGPIFSFGMCLMVLRTHYLYDESQQTNLLQLASR